MKKAPLRIRVKLRSYDHRLLDNVTSRLVRAAVNTGAAVRGPVPLPTKRKIITVLRSPHIDKKSREQFMLLIHRRLVDIYPQSPQATVDSLSKLDIPSGVDIEVKLV